MVAVTDDGAGWIAVGPGVAISGDGGAAAGSYKVAAEEEVSVGECRAMRRRGGGCALVVLRWDRDERGIELMVQM